ncbi:MAG: hypothetical protein [Arizlama microvirus]|nr:MAG: hypothetical protein [Arizlama microvirus]
MARRRRSNTVRREISTISNRRLSGPIRRSRPAFKLSPLREIEDRRDYHPEGPARPARSLSSARHRLVMTPQPQLPSRLPDTFTPTIPVGVSFEAPRRVAICVRRKQRREVLHALGKTGRGSRHHRKPRKSYYSEVNCT